MHVGIRYIYELINSSYTLKESGCTFNPLVAITPLRELKITPWKQISYVRITHF